MTLDEVKQALPCEGKLILPLYLMRRNVIMAVILSHHVSARVVLHESLPVLTPVFFSVKNSCDCSIIRPQSNFAFTSRPIMHVELGLSKTAEFLCVSIHKCPIKSSK